MKNKDNIINKEYEISLMKLSDIKKLIMDNYNLSLIDIFRFYSCIKIPFDNDNKILVDGIYDDGDKLGIKKVKYKYHYFSPDNLYELFRYEEAIKAGYLNINIEEYDYTIRKDNREKSSNNYIKDLAKGYFEETNEDNNYSIKNLTKNYFRDDDIYKIASLDTFVKDRQVNLLENSLKVVEDNKFFLEAIETSPIILNKKKDGKYDLIDGFFRVLISQPKIDPVVIVKIYDDLNDNDWFNLMATFNAWKSTNIEMKMTLDRGFLFGLYTRFNIDPKNYVSFDYNNDIFNIMLNYFSASSENSIFEYKKYIKVDVMRSCNYFVEDMKAFEKLCKLVPNDNVLEHNSYTYFYRKLLSYIISTVGDIRRNNSECEQNKLDVNIIDNLLKDKDYKKEFNRLCKMQIPGRIDNAFPKIIGTKTKEYLNSVLLN